MRRRSFKIKRPPDKKVKQSFSTDYINDLLNKLCVSSSVKEDSSIVSDLVKFILKNAISGVGFYVREQLDGVLFFIELDNGRYNLPVYLHRVQNLFFGDRGRRILREATDFAGERVSRIPDIDGALVVFVEEAKDRRYGRKVLLDYMEFTPDDRRSGNGADSGRHRTPMRHHRLWLLRGTMNKTLRILSKLALGRDGTEWEKFQTLFSLSSLTDEFYKEFMAHFRDREDSLMKNIIATEGVETEVLPARMRQDIALLSALRIMFLGFVQRKGLLGADEFLPRLAEAITKSHGATGDDTLLHSVFQKIFNAVGRPPDKRKECLEIPEELKDDGEIRKLWEHVKALPYLNGELFKPHEEYYHETGRTESLDSFFISSHALASFTDFLFSYNFTTDESSATEDLLDLTPAFLGMIFERMVGEDESGDKGVVYTPRLVVDFMARLALVRWLETRLDREMGEFAPATSELYKLVFHEKAPEGEDPLKYQLYGDFTPAQIERLWEALSSVRVVDPAAGSGAFLMGMMDVILEVMENLLEHQDRTRWAEVDDAIRLEAGYGTFRDDVVDAKKSDAYHAWRKSRKLGILKNSIHGVEIRKWAVWISQMRLWLSVLMDSGDLSGTEALLPNLALNVVEGDSLLQVIGEYVFPTDRIVARGNQQELVNTPLKPLTEEARRVRSGYFTNTSHHEELKEKWEEVRRGIVKTLFTFMPGTDQKGNPVRPDPEELERLLRHVPFLWGVNFIDIFHENGGFDIVIGNPPYLSINSKKNKKGVFSDPLGRFTSKQYKKILKQSIENTISSISINSMYDLYAYFYISGIKTLNKHGVLSFITSNSWLSNTWGRDLQSTIIKLSKIFFIIDFSESIFKNAKIKPAITILTKTNGHYTNFVHIKRHLKI